MIRSSRPIMTLVLALLALIATSVPAVAQEEGASEDAAQVTPATSPDEAPALGSADEKGQQAAADAAERAQEAAETAAENPSAVPLAELELRLAPLRRAQLEQEVDRWLGLLQARSVELAEKEIEARRAEGELKADLVAEAATIRAQRTALIDRVRLVIAALERKGGQVDEFRRYVDLQAGIQIDTSDWRGALLTVWNWVKAPDGGVRVGLRILTFLVILFAFWLLARATARITRGALGRVKKSSALLREFLSGLVFKVIMVLGVVVAATQLGINPTPLVAAIGGAVIVIGLALQGTLSNFASGIMILMFRPFDVGDAVEAGGVSGKVESLSLVSTTILTFDNQVKIVPNTAIWGNVITNLTGRPTRRVDLVFGISYADDMAHAARILEQVVKSHEKVLPEPAPNIRVSQLGDSSVNFIVRPWVKTPDYWDVYWDLTRQVKERFDAEGVTIPFPQRDVHVHQVMLPDAQGDSR